MSETTREKVLVEPQPSRPDFFEWLEELFDGKTEFPERIEIYLVSGRHANRRERMLQQFIFEPARKTLKVNGEAKEKNGETTEIKRGKPTREELVALSNKILNRCQTDCDGTRVETKFSIQAIHFSRGDQPYKTFTLHLSPQIVHAAADRVGGAGVTFDDESNLETQYAVQKLQHNERMFTLNAEMTMGLVDRQARELDRLHRELATAHQKIATLHETIYRMQAEFEKERAEWAKWRRESEMHALKVEGLRKAMVIAESYGPPMLNQLLGKQPPTAADGSQQITPSVESIAIRKFLTLHENGGRLTREQCASLLGVYTMDDPPRLVTPGILMPEQGNLLDQVADCKLPVSALDQLLPGAVPLGVTPQQLGQLQDLFPMDQIGPIVALIHLRWSRRQNEDTQKQNSAS